MRRWGVKTSRRRGYRRRGVEASRVQSLGANTPIRRGTATPHATPNHARHRTSAHLPGAVEEVVFVVLDTMLGAERHNQLVSRRQRVARHGGEEVVVDLVLEAPTQPVHEPVARDVARGRHLQFGLGFGVNNNRR